MKYDNTIDTNFIKKNQRSKIILAIIGPSATGKDTLAKELESRFGWKRLVSDTSRPRRKNETDRVDYNFLSEKQFLDKIHKNLYLEWTCFRKWFYGTSRDQLGDNTIYIGVFNISGLLSLSHVKDIEIVPIYLNDPFKTRLKRSIKRENKFKVEYLRRGISDAFDFYRFKPYLSKTFLHFIDMTSMD